MKNVVLGAGVAGLVTAFYNDDYQVISNNILGELNSKFQLGPRLLQINDATLSLIKNILPSSTQTIKCSRIGYEYLNKEVQDYATEEFKKKYSKLTRGKSTYESSYLSDSQNKIYHYSINESDNSYKLLFSTIVEQIKDRILLDDIVNINLKTHIIILKNNSQIEFDKLVSTIPAPVFFRLCNEEIKCDFSTTSKNFYVCELLNQNDKELSKKYSYLYSVGKKYSRKTYIGNQIVYEFIRESTNSKQIDSNKIIDSILNIPIQINSSCHLSTYKDILFNGRYAQWSHKVKLQEVIDRAIKIKNHER
jgi:protoporphyrinogen oxidase